MISPSMKSTQSSSADRAASSGRYQPLAGGGPAPPVYSIERSAACQHPVNRGARRDLLDGSILERKTNRVGSKLTQYAFLTQEATHAQNALFDLGCGAVSCPATPRAREHHPVNTLATRVIHPIGHRARAHAKFGRHRTQAPPRANLPDHLAAPLFNRTFLTITPPSKSDYRTPSVRLTLRPR